MTPLPLSLAIDLEAEFNEWILAATHYMADDDPLAIEWDEKVRKVEQSQPALGHLSRALWHQLRGDAGSVETSAAQAMKELAPHDVVLRIKLGTYGNLGYASKALFPFREAIGIKFGNLHQGILWAPAIGAFSRLAELLDNAAVAKIDITDLKDAPRWAAASRALALAGVSDETCALVIDVAGEIMRSRRLFWIGQSHGVITNGLHQPVGLKIRVDVPAAVAAEMNGEFADLLIERDLAHVPFFVTFIGNANAH